MLEHRLQQKMTFLADDHALLVAAVREAGALAMQHFRTEVRVWEKPGGTPVSDADMAVNALIHARLREARPDYGWLSEETEDDTARLGCRRVWVVDPIDGTRAFLQGVAHFCHAVALVEDGRPIAAALFNPAVDEFYEAVTGEGAKLNGRPIQVSDRQDIAGCRMAAFGPMFRNPRWPEPWPDMDIIQRDSVAYRLALVASGDADAALGLNTKNDWDLAAADLIVCEAGGRVSSHTGQPLLYNGVQPRHPSFLAAGPGLYTGLFDRIRHFKPRTQ
jgi:myo-inositol-1(or 4)-monophosphatase